MSEHVYTDFGRNGVVALSTAGMLSLTAVLVASLCVVPRLASYKRTQILGYFLCLLVSNIVQSTGTVMNIKWIQLGKVVYGPFCRAQGGIKQAGNIGNALWTLIIAFHLFDQLFLRYRISRPFYLLTVLFGWSFVILIVVIGPAAIETPSKGPYFGISGDWCWITDEYRLEQTFLEYFFEYFSAGFSFLLYTAILLRVRGNLIIENRRPRLRFVSKEDRWQLNLGRDFTDLSVSRAVKQMVWYPVAYSVLIIPIGLARLSEFAGRSVPHWATIVTDVIFNLTGLVNVLVFVVTHRLFPEIHSLPQYVTPRKQISKSIHARHGVEPFMLGFGQSAPVSIAPALYTEKPLPPVPVHSRSSSLDTYKELDFVF